MPRKIIPVPGVPPHHWHKHQPESNEEETEQDNMAPYENSVDMTTESIVRQDSDIPMEPKTRKVPLKQWTTTANDPARLRRLMPGGYEPLRKSCHSEHHTSIDTESTGAAPKMREAGDYGGRLLYPHEAVAAVERDPSPEPERHVRHYPDPENLGSQPYSGSSRVVKPQPLNVYRQSEKRWSEPAGVPPQEASNNERIGAWRDFAANPEPLKDYPQLQKVSGPTHLQHQHTTNLGSRTHLIEEQPKHSHSENSAEQVQSDQGAMPENVFAPGPGAHRGYDQLKEAREPTKCSEGSMPDRVYGRNTGPRAPYDQPEKDKDPFQSDNDLDPTTLRRQYGTKPTSLGAYPQAEKTRVLDQSSTDSNSVAPAPMRSPDIRDMQIPRPNRNYAASVRSMVSVLSLDEDDNARGDRFLDRSPMKHSDIRSKIGLEHNLHMSGGKLINTDIWAEKPRRPEGIFLDPVYANPWIEDYVENQTDYDVRANFLYEEDPIVHCHCDVDTFSGKLLNPYQHDYTVPDYMDSASLHRQMTSTASLYVKRKAIKANVRNNNPGPPRPPLGWVDTPTPLSTATPEPPVPQKQAQPVARLRAESDPHPFSPRIPCHLRPAIWDDMEGVRAIYNWEVLNGIQALDTEPLSLADWEGILKKSQEEKLPFVVVIRGPYQPQDDTEPIHQDDLAGKVLAFGFLTIRQPGLAGSFNGTSRMSAKAHIFVHPGYRRKKLGHVCLDKLLSTVSTRYATKLGYEFVNINDNPTYMYPRHHDRKIYSVFVEYFVPRIQQRANDRFLADETDLKWFERVITSRYGFWKVARLDAAHRSRRSYEPAPIWLDTVMFEHMCQEGLNFTHEF